MWWLLAVVAFIWLMTIIGVYEGWLGTDEMGQRPTPEKEPDITRCYQWLHHERDVWCPIESCPSKWLDRRSLTENELAYSLTLEPHAPGAIK